MASPLTKSIMNNISKKKLNKESCSNKIDNYKSIDNINEKEEELLKSILYKNKTKVNLNALRNDKAINKIDKKEIDKSFIKYKQVEKLGTKKQSNTIKSIKDLGNRNNAVKEDKIQCIAKQIDNKAKVEVKSLKSLSQSSSNIKETLPKDKKMNKKLSLKDLAK